jgi:hypothetical protein
MRYTVWSQQAINGLAESWTEAAKGWQAIEQTGSARFRKQ